MYVSISAIEDGDGDLSVSESRGLPSDGPTPSNELRDPFAASPSPWTEGGLSPEEGAEDGVDGFWSRAPRELKVDLPSSLYERSKRSARQPGSPRPSQRMEMIAPSIMTPGDALDGAFDYRPDIDGLRSIAVAAVVAFHFDSRWLPGGFTGVDVFFVISGYVVAGSLLHSPSNSAADFLAGFYARRAKRLLPSFTAMLCATALALGACFPPWMPEVDTYYLSAAFAGVGMSNIHFSTLHGGYFDDGGGLASLKRNPFTHTWSLAVEEQFYFVYPLLVFLLYGSRASAASSLQLVCGRPVFALLFCAACSIFASGFLTERNATLAFFLLPSRFWELACGAILFDLRAFSSGYVDFITRRRNGIMLEVAATLLLTCAFVITEERRGFPIPGAFLPVSGAACFIAAGSAPDALLNRCLGSCMPVYIGKLSYPIYLWHWPLLVCGRWMLGDEALRSGRGIMVLLTALLSLAAFSYHVLEAPFREWRPRRFCLVFVISASVVGMSELWVSSLRGQLGGQIYSVVNAGGADTGMPHVATQAPKGDSMSLRRRPAAEFGNGSGNASANGSANGSASRSANGSAGASGNGSVNNTVRGRRHGALDARPNISSNGSVNGSAPVNGSIPEAHFPASDPGMCRCYSLVHTLRTPAGAQNGTSGVGGPCFEEALPPMTVPPHFLAPAEHPCFISFQSEEASRADMEPCLQPDRGPDGKRAIFLIGDSHAMHWKPALEAAVQGLFTLVYLTAGFPCEYDPSDMRGYGGACTEFDRIISRSLSTELRPGDLVVYGMMAKTVTHRPPASRDELIAFVLRLHDRAAARGASLLLMADNPQLPGPGRYCLPSALRPDAAQRCEVPVDEAREANSAQLEVYRNVTVQRPGTLVFHAADLYCGQDTCGAFVPGSNTLAIWDDSHLTEAGSLYAWPFLCSLLQSSGVM